MRYSDKVVIVTGGSRGIGEGCVREFARVGAKVVFCAPRDGDGAKLESELKGAAAFIRCDVTRPDEIRNLIDQTAAKFGRIDCLINNAGWHPPYKMIDDFSLEDFQKIFELNVMSVFAASKFALPHLRKTKGNIINIASLVGSMGQPGATTYVATKGAVLALTKALAIDEAANDVRVNSVSPGNIFTPMWQEGIDASSDPKKTLDDGNAAQLMGRMGTIEEAGKLCLFIAADATFTTGVDHVLSGGAELSYGRKTRKP